MLAFRIAVSLYVIAYGGLLQGQTISFLRPAEIHQGGASGGSSICNTCVGVADFNGDGKMDIIYAGSVLTPFAGVLFGNGDGTFRPGFSFDARQLEPLSHFAIGDFNGDGKPDVVFSAKGGEMYLGIGDGSFSGPFTFGACAYPQLFSVSDLNHDGKQDLVCGISVLLSNGDGTFHAAPSLDGSALLVADFNRDGNVDILLTTASGQLAVVPGRGDGSFGPDLPVSNPLTLQTILVGDFNGDGQPDIVGTSKDLTLIAVLPGRGDGTFGLPVTTLGVPGPLTAAADFNQDGNLDLIAGDAVLAGKGDGTFRFPVFVGVVPEECNPNYASAGGMGCTYAHNATTVADFNGDGLPDIASGYVLSGFQSRRAAFVSVMLNDSPGDGFTAAGVSSATGTWPVSPGSIVSAFGINLAPQTEAAAVVSMLPTTLGGIRLHVRDRSHPTDSLAPLLYVSPTQINYVLNSSDPYAWVAIERVGSPYVPKGIAVPVMPFAPALYSAGPSMLALASALRIAPDGSRTSVPVTACAGPICNSIPIDVSGDPVYLSLYGTGFSMASSADSKCVIGNLTLPAMYVGMQGQIVGLDQLNVLLPASLAGSGDVVAACSFGFVFSPVLPSLNLVRLRIR